MNIIGTATVPEAAPLLVLPLMNKSLPPVFPLLDPVFPLLDPVFSSLDPDDPLSAPGPEQAVCNSIIIMHYCVDNINYKDAKPAVFMVT